jgi:mannose-1-phosphate guanylyltransferase
MVKFPELKENLRIVIFCGGYGTRMWPMSRRSFAKQFQPLLGENSFFEEAIRRVRLTFKPEEIYISAPKEQLSSIKKQAEMIPLKNIIAEPERRDTLGAVALATAFLDKYFPNSLMAVVWGADHLVKDASGFNHLLRLAARVCQVKNVICKIDVKPTYPSVDNGWVKLGKKIGTVNKHPIYEFLNFVEKPDLATAKKMFRNDNYLLNTGYFVWRTSTMLGLLKKYTPSCYRTIIRIQKALESANEQTVLENEYRKIEKISIDYGLFEKLPSQSMLVIPADIGWYDVGTWDLLYEALARGQKENVAKGETEFIESRGNLVYLPKNKLAALIGVDNLVVIDTRDGLLVCKRGLAAEVKKLVESLKKQNKTQYL